jgi:1-phosphatidylinositol-3-phosphate 5-kinase
MLVPPHSKVVLSEAVRNDCNFLSKNNIMDYSYVQSSVPVSHYFIMFCRLLLGVDEEQKRIICGLVDTIGA